MDYRKILREHWGYPDFRGIQRDIIESIGSGKDTLGLMPTGGGKSITFQVPALAMEGVCLVITPLISLMKDQVDHLLQKGIRAAAIYSGMRRSEIVQTLENAIFGGIKLLYISPERLSSDLFRVKLRHMKVSFITVDEAHCISQWGYDFRPSYLQIAQIRQLIPSAPVLALTATATPKVVEDIQTQLHFREVNVFKMSFARPNLAYIVRQTQDKQSELVHILRSTQGPAIVYTRSRDTTRDTARLLQQSGISATYYHAGLDPSEKENRQNEWQADKVRVMVATNAFGMGIDKPDVGIVIHTDAPSSIEAYFQEAGRAGRNGERAYTVLLYNHRDATKLKARIDATFPEKDLIREVYNQLAYFYEIGVGSGQGHTFEFGIDRFCRAFKHFPTHVHAALEILQRAGYLTYDANPDSKARIKFLLGRDELYRIDYATPNENAVITALLRNYGGLFIDFCYIDETLLAKDADLSREDTYTTLRGLDKKGIVKFIPRKNIPLIGYPANRIDGSEITLSPSVYEERKAEFEKRIQAMTAYCENDEECRSRQLLAYFGEQKSKDCGCCDVCLSHRKAPDTDLRGRILQLLSDHQGHSITEIKQQFGQTEAGEVLARLMEEEVTVTDGTSVWMA